MSLIRFTPSSQIVMKEVGDVVLLELIGNFDVPSESNLFDLVDSKLLEGRRKFLFKCVRWNHTSDGFGGTLLRAVLAIQKCGGCWRFCGVKPRIRHFFEMARFSTLLNMVESCEEALNELRQEPSSSPS